MHLFFKKNRSNNTAGIPDKSALLGFLLLTQMATSVYAFDDKRTGLVIGVGVGGSAIEQRYQGTAAIDKGGSYTGMAASARFGLGFSEKLIYYFLVTEMAMYDAPYADQTDSASYSSYLGGVELAYYVKPVTPSMYFNAGVGWGYQDVEYAGTEKEERGSGILFGAGYEFRPHMSVELNYLRTVIASQATDVDMSHNSAINVLFQYLFY